MTARPHLKPVDVTDPQALEEDLQAVGPLPDGHPTVAKGKIGVLLVNLGTPDAPTASAVRRYLAEFLSDERIVDYPRAVWLPLLHGVILNVRPAKTAKAYASIWMNDTDESPLRRHTRELSENVGERLSGHDDVMVDWAMRYGTPAVDDRIKALQAAGCDRIVVLPLYPQYSSTTTASVNDAVFKTLQNLKWQPALRIVPAFHDHAGYIDAVSASLEKAIESVDWEPERVVLSFHGVPQRLLTEGDPYHCQCAKSARLIREKLGWTEEFAPITFQSRFGPEKWLGPATDETIDQLAEQGIKNIVVVTPGFVADCLETLEEIGMEAAESFHEKGGENFLAAPCLNSSPEMIDLISDLVTSELKGWAVSAQ